MNRHNNNITTINTPQKDQKVQQKHSISLDAFKAKEQVKGDPSSIIIPQQRYEDSASEFLQLGPQMIEKLKKLDQKKNRLTKNSSIEKLKENKGIHATQNSQKSRLNKSVEQQNEKKSKLFLRRQQEDRQSQEHIKKQFINKLKQWSKQKDDIEKKKHYIQQKKQFLSQELQSKKVKEKQEEQQFIKLQKRKQIQQKIHQIQERRRQREESLKNAVLRRSYNGVPKYLEYQQKFNAKEEEDSLLNLKLIKNKKAKMSLDPQQLKIHEKAYIERIKQRLNMNSKKGSKNEDSDQHKRANSDFNLYLKRSEQLKKVQLQKIIRRKKFQEKISKIPVKIDDQKKIEVLISIDKAKNPQKYHILSQKALNDQQIYSQFKDFNINLDPKQLGDDYLSQLKSKPKVAKARSQTQLHTKTRSLDPEPIKSPVLQKHQKEQSKSAKELALPPIKSGSLVAASEVKTYQQSLKRKKERDSKYLKQLQKKLAFMD